MKITGWYNSYGNSNQKARLSVDSKLVGTSIGGRTGVEPDCRLMFETLDTEKTLIITMSIDEANEFVKRISSHLKNI